MRIDGHNLPGQRLNTRKANEGYKGQAGEYQAIADRGNGLEDPNSDVSVDRVEFSGRSQESGDQAMQRYKAAAAALQRRMFDQNQVADGSEDVLVNSVTAEESASESEAVESAPENETE